jgi:sulfur-oxidizing protein SoxB
MVDASQLLGVDVMTGHWEFTLGAERVMDILDNELKGQVEFIAHNVKDMDFGDPIFASHTLREMNGVPVAIIGQAFPYTPIANPAYFTPGWTFGIQERELQEKVNEVKAAGAQVVVLLSHNGADADIKLASRVSGIDAILGGHTHDAIPRALEIANPEGVTLVTNAGSNGKFIGCARLRCARWANPRLVLRAVTSVCGASAPGSRHGGVDCAHQSAIFDSAERAVGTH